MTKRDLRAVALIVVLWTAMQLPFVSSAYRVDEPNIIRIAERAAAAPADPYGFYLNWNGIEEEAFHILANPPLVPYWLAVWGTTLSWSESVLHLSMLPFSIIAIVAFAALAAEYAVRPALAAILLIASPGFFLGSQVVMPDVAMLGFFLAALACAVRYMRTGSAWLIWAGFAAGALTPLAKYNGALLGPLLALLWLVGRGRRTGLFVIASGPVVGLGLWSLGSLMIYGRAHVQAIAEFESGGTVVILSAILGYFAFGALPLVLAPSSAPRPLTPHILNAVTILLAALMGVCMYAVFPVGPWASAGFGLSAGITFRFMLIIAAVGWQCIDARDVMSGLLIVWIVLVFWFQFGLLFSSVRYLLPIVPPVVILVLKHALVRVEAGWFRPALVASLALTLSVAIGDARAANLYRQFVVDRVIPAKEKIAGRFLFDGHWGFQYYMEREGARCLNFFSQPKLRDGDVIFIARTPFPSYQHLPSTRALSVETEEIARSPEWPVRTIDCSAFANFYGPGVRECKGPVLPFGFSMKARDEFAILSVRLREESGAP